MLDNKNSIVGVIFYILTQQYITGFAYFVAYNVHEVIIRSTKRMEYYVVCNGISHCIINMRAGRCTRATS